LRLCSQMLEPPHCLQVLLRRLCSQMLAPPHCLHSLKIRLPPTPSSCCCSCASLPSLDEGRFLFSTASSLPQAMRRLEHLRAQPHKRLGALFVVYGFCSLSTDSKNPSFRTFRLLELTTLI
jgi:hypothetical protein